MRSSRAAAAAPGRAEARAIAANPDFAARAPGRREALA